MTTIDTITTTVDDEPEDNPRDAPQISLRELRRAPAHRIILLAQRHAILTHYRQPVAQLEPFRAAESLS